jgi:hypothetical protein
MDFCPFTSSLCEPESMFYQVSIVFFIFFFITALVAGSNPGLDSDYILRQKLDRWCQYNVTSYP